MAVNFIARKCACGGKLEFDPQKKIWICKYCGTVVEREATFDKVQVDGIEGINDVVRQALMDVANNKMDAATRNLEDCERKNHKHVGTVIAHISYNLSMISCAKTPDEARGYLDKVKIYAKRLQTEFPVIAEDEINLYEAFGEGVADIYANLMVVFDTLNDAGRVEYISSKLHAGEIFSEYANKNLLKIALKRKNYEIAETVINNKNHIDKKISLQEIMTNYPIQDKKAELIEKLFSAQIAEAVGKGFFEQYFATSEDTIRIKTMVISKLVATDLRCNSEAIVKSLHNQMTNYDEAKNVFSTLYEAKVSDQETEALLVFCLMVNKAYYVLNAYLDALTEKKIFVQLSSRAVISFLDDSQLGANEKRDILVKMFGFEMDAKSKDAIYNYYLNNNKDSKEDRLVIIDTLITPGCPISNNTVKNYVVKTAHDEENKLEIIQHIFEMGINKTYLGDLLSEYLLSSSDANSVKDEVSEYLIDCGFKVDSNIFTQYVISKKDSIELRIAKAKKLIQNGTQVRPDCLESYILSIDATDAFSEEMFNILSKSVFTITANSYLKYLMNCKDIDKVRHSNKLLSGISTDLSSTNINFSYNDDSLCGNVLQAYVLTTQDSYDVARAIVNDMLSMKIKMNSEVIVNGLTTKFKKYVAEKKATLSPLALKICEENKMFSLF